MSRYGLAILSIVVATFLRKQFDAALGDQFPFATLFFAVLVTAWYGGLWPGLAATAFGGLVASWFLLPPGGTFAVEGFPNRAGLLLFGAVSVGIAWLGEQMRAAERRAQVLAEQSLMREEQVRATLSNIGDGVIVTDTQGHVLSMNQIAESLTGWSSDAAAGQPAASVFRLVHETTQSAVENPVQQALLRKETVEPGERSLLIARDGTQRPVSESAAPILDRAGSDQGAVLVFRDVSERRRAERDLQESETRFRLMADTAPVLIWTSGLEQQCLFVNRPWLEFTGQTFAEATSAGWIERVHPEDRQHWRAIYEAAAAVEQPYRLEYRLRRSDGEYRWLLESAVPRQAYDGAFAGYIGSCIDITERKKLEVQLHQRLAELAEAEGRIRSVVDHVVDGIVTIDEQGRVATFNPAAERIFGYPASDVIGRNVSFLMPEPYHSQHDEYLQNYLKSGVPRVIGIGRELEGRRRDGSTFPLDLAVSEFRIDQKRYFTGLVRDITERRRAEQANRFLGDASAALAAIADDESTLQRVARLAVPFLADWCTVDLLEREGTLRRAAIAHVDPELRELAEEFQRLAVPDPEAAHGVWQVVRSGRSELVSEMTDLLLRERVQDDRLLRILKTLGIRSLMAVPLSVRGKVIGAMTLIRSRGDRHYAAGDLALAEELAHRAAVALDNAQLFKALREGDRRKDEFLAILAHELRNPLAPIRNALQILKQPGLGPSTAEQARDMAERQVHHLTRLVDDLLDVERIMHGKIALRCEQVELKSIVSRAVETVEPLIKSAGHELLVSLPSRPIRVDADLVRMAQVVSNLLNNASKYTPAPGTIEVSCAVEREQAVLRVRDSGIGIKPELLPRIFDMFVQLDPSESHARGGLGLGLTLVKALVELHQGSIEAQSAGPGRGTEFVIRLPVSATRCGPTEDSNMPSLDPASSTAVRRRVLIVDDNRDAAESLGMLLRLLGHEVQVAHHGNGALAAVAEDPPEIVLLDIGMPGMDGYEVARRLRALPEGKQLVLVALTGWGQEHDRQRSRAAGFDQHLTKPVEPATLQAVLQMRPPELNGRREAPRTEPALANGSDSDASP